MQESNPIETRNVVNNPSIGAQIFGFLGNAVNTAASVYQAKLASETIRNNSTGEGVTGTATEGNARAAAAWNAAPWALPALFVGIGVLVLALLRRR